MVVHGSVHGSMLFKLVVWLSLKKVFPSTLDLEIALSINELRYRILHVLTGSLVARVFLLHACMMTETIKNPGTQTNFKNMLHHMHPNNHLLFNQVGFHKIYNKLGLPFYSLGSLLSKKKNEALQPTGS